MHSNKSNANRAASTRGFMALFAVLAMGLALAAAPAEAAPFAYVTNVNEGFPITPGTVSVIDTATNTVVATVTVGFVPIGVAVAPDGKLAYVANEGDGTVSVIDTTSNTVVATVPLGVNRNPFGVAITPDGKHVYVTNGCRGIVSVIDTTTNPPRVGTAITVGSSTTGPIEVVITPDGTRAYVTQTTGVVVINTASNTIMATITVGLGPNPYGVAITPDGKHAYVTNDGDGSVSVIDTASNTVVARVRVGNYPLASVLCRRRRG